MSRDDLKQYQKRKQLIDAYNAELATGLPVADSVKASMRDDPYLERVVTIRGVDVARGQWLRERIRNLEKQCQRAEAFVESVADEYTQTLLYLHYIKGLSWPQVRKTLKIRDITANCLRMRVERYFSQNP